MIVMNNPTSIFEAIEKCAATNSKKEKETIVAAIVSVPLGLKVLMACYDNFKVWGIGKNAVPKKREGMAPGANQLDDPMVWGTLDALATRQLTGDEARDKVQNLVDLLEPASSELFRRILMKDMRAGFTDGTINRVRKGTFPEFPYMRCTLPKKSNIDSWDWLVGIIAQLKADGSFTNINYDKAGVVWLTTRAGTDVPLENLKDIEAAIRAHLIPGTQTHGEMVVFKAGKLMAREDGNGVINSVLAGGTPEPDEEIRLQVWDQIPLSAVKPKGEYTVGYKERLVELAKAVKAGPGGPISVVPTKVVKSRAEAWDYYRQLLKEGREGVVLKHPNASWKDTGTGHKDVVKLKLEAPAEYRVKGFNKGNGKNEGKISSLVCGTECGELEFSVTCRGDAMIEDVTKNPSNWLDAIITVKANSIMVPEEPGEKHSLFLPVFVERRTDRTAADTLVRVREQFEAAMEAA